ncbi:MAG TPA: peptidyl-prolyl cis-trans isomerase [Thioploca sp.]|nr:peptidyl-prolyl cis-trans isomerase [Thioploca sp.]
MLKKTVISYISWLFREPLIHFLLLGTALFILQGWVSQEEEPDSSRRIDISTGLIERLQETWTKQRKRTPTAKELQGLVDGHLKEEIFYREALRMGLDQNDTIIRRRLAQKMGFLIEDLVPNNPSAESLKTFFVENAERYREPARITFTHIYFSKDYRDNAEADAVALLEEFKAQAKPPLRASKHGDAFMLNYDYADQSWQKVAQSFGRDFADAVFKLEPDNWQGPLISAYGFHLVRVSQRTESRLKTLDEVQDKVYRDWRYTRRKQANQNAYAKLWERYEVVVEESVGTLVDGKLVLLNKKGAEK